MASIPYQTPDLASVLATLAAYAPPPQLAPPIFPPSPPFIPTSAPLQEPQEPQEIEEGEYDPSEYDPSVPPPSAGVPPALPSDPRLQPHIPAPHPPPAKPLAPPAPSPSKITTWAPAFRHVTKLLVPNPDVTRRIAHLIHTQQRHERQWWAGREALVQKLQNREEGRQKLNDVLASVGGVTRPITSDSVGSLHHPTHSLSLTLELSKPHSFPPQTPSSSSPSELLVYDRKVHRACTEMSAATTAELANLGVPFFALDPALIITSDAGKIEGNISKKEVDELKMRMLTVLQDLCGE